MKIKEVADYLESIAPKALQESYDNSGLIVGNPNDEVHGVLVTLDCTEEVVEEAITKGASLIIAHHPIVFKGLKKFTGSNYVERTVIKAIQSNVAIYAIHTNLDHVLEGVNGRIADKLSLHNRQILSPKSGQLTKLVTFVPPESVDSVLDAIHEAGAGHIGNYSECSYYGEGKGSYRPNDAAEPTVGKAGEKSTVQEARVEVILPSHQQSEVLEALLATHPYDEVAYYFTTLENMNDQVGAGLLGELAEPLTGQEFLQFLKESMSLEVIKYTALPTTPIKTVAICGGAGSFLLPMALSKKADAFVSADFKYHEFFDAENKLVICDIGHYESEIYTKDLLYDLLTKNFTNFAVNLSEFVTNPIKYFN